VGGKIKAKSKQNNDSQVWSVSPYDKSYSRYFVYRKADNLFWKLSGNKIKLCKQYSNNTDFHWFIKDR